MFPFEPGSSNIIYKLSRSSSNPFVVKFILVKLLISSHKELVAILDEGVHLKRLRKAIERFK